MARAFQILLILVTTVAVASAYVGGIRYAKLVAESDLIVVGQVTKVTGSRQSRYAEAKIVETWKGPRLATVLFVASPTWTCDTSDAVLNESALLFLDKGKNNTYQIAHAGRGRMPLRQLKGQTYATIWDDVYLGPNVVTIPGPEPKYDFIRSVRLDTLRKLAK